jgi:hypothetical protein
MPRHGKLPVRLLAKPSSGVVSAMRFRVTSSRSVPHHELRFAGIEPAHVAHHVPLNPGHHREGGAGPFELITAVLP